MKEYVSRQNETLKAKKIYRRRLESRNQKSTETIGTCIKDDVGIEAKKK